MESKITYQKLKDFSEGRYSWRDYLKIKELFASSSEFARSRDTFETLWKETTSEDFTDPDRLTGVFEKIHYQILKEEKQSARTWNLWKIYRQVAAFLLLPALLFSVLLYLFSVKTGIPQDSWAEIVAPKGSRISFTLPDGTKGWMNSGSILRYPVVFNDHRKVELSGEAFFDVMHRDKGSFMVSTPDADIQVKGTRFNVMAYPEETVTEVVLQEGKVEITGKTTHFSIALAPSGKMTYNRITHQTDTSKVHTRDTAAWKEGYLVLANEPLGMVAGRLERWYNSEIILKDETLKKYRFKATFRDEPLEEVLRLLAMTTPITYKIEKREANQEGLYLTKRVTISMKK